MTAGPPRSRDARTCNTPTISRNCGFSSGSCPIGVRGDYMTVQPQLASAGDRPDAADHSAPAANADPFVINLCSSTTPMALSHPDTPELKRFRFFVSRRLEDGRERFRLHMGYFDTLEEAEEWLSVVRDVYPGAWAGEAPGKRLRARQAAADQPPQIHSAQKTAETAAAAGAIAAPPAPAAALSKALPVATATAAVGTRAVAATPAVEAPKKTLAAAAVQALPPAPIVNPPKDTAAPVAARTPVPPAPPTDSGKGIPIQPSSPIFLTISYGNDLV